MKTMQLVFSAVLFLAWPVPNGRAEDTPRELPKDGTWVQYRVETVASQGGEKVESSATLTLSLVGTVDQDGATCRWFEIKQVTHDPPRLAETRVLKMLIPEKELLTSAKPFDKVRRAWARRNDNEVRAVELSSGMQGEDFLLWTPGMLNGSETVKEGAKDIDYQQGRLSHADARTGETVQKTRLPNNKELKQETKFTVWQHPNLSLGFAEAKIVREHFNDAIKVAQSTSVYRVQDIGTDAKSGLPDNN